jgi:hypothetical protein
MDPNATLAIIRDALRDFGDATMRDEADAAADVLVEHVQALDEWLTRGGFLPADWARNRV